MLSLLHVGRNTRHNAPYNFRVSFELQTNEQGHAYQLPVRVESREQQTCSWPKLEEAEKQHEHNFRANDYGIRANDRCYWGYWEGVSHESDRLGHGRWEKLGDR